MSKRYHRSEVLLKKALRVIPLGTQTFSKSKTHYPFGVSPYFIQRGQGSHVWDVDGHEYVDFINALASVTLGYNDPDVFKAVSTQLKRGTIFSLPHPLEVEVAQLITHMVPGAEMVRFGKNGSDVTAGAIRLARAYTGRDHVAVCGYHGWQDWYIGSTSRNAGVPKTTQTLTHPFMYNDIDSLYALFKRHPGKIAAIIMEPMNSVQPKPGFLESVKKLTHQKGALLIFDETITGFRFSQGGAQAFFHVTADLATFGKGVANGYPLSVLSGRAKYMKWMEKIFFSFTFGGETLSLAAAKATLVKLQRRPVIETLARQGQKVMEGVSDLIDQFDLHDVLTISGHPSWSFLTFHDAGRYTSWQIKSLYLQEIFRRGILAIGTHNMSFSHSDADIRRLMAVYREVFPLLQDAVHNGSLKKHLHCEPLKPLFKLR